MMMVFKMANNPLHHVIGNDSLVSCCTNIGNLAGCPPALPQHFFFLASLWIFPTSIEKSQTSRMCQSFVAFWGVAVRCLWYICWSVGGWQMYSGLAGNWTWKAFHLFQLFSSMNPMSLRNNCCGSGGCIVWNYFQRYVLSHGGMKTTEPNQCTYTGCLDLRHANFISLSSILLQKKNLTFQGTNQAFLIIHAMVNVFKFDTDLQLEHMTHLNRLLGKKEHCCPIFWLFLCIWFS